MGIALLSNLTDDARSTPRMRGLRSDEREIPMFHAKSVHSSKAQISKSKTQTSLHQEENMASVESRGGSASEKTFM